MAIKSKKKTKKVRTTNSRKIDKEIKAELTKAPKVSKSNKKDNAIVKMLESIMGFLSQGFVNTITSQLERIINTLIDYSEKKIIEIEKRVIRRVYVAAFLIISFIFLSLAVLSFLTDVAGLTPMVSYLTVAIIFFGIGFIYEIINIKEDEK